MGNSHAELFKKAANCAHNMYCMKILFETISSVQINPCAYCEYVTCIYINTFFLLQSIIQSVYRENTTVIYILLF